MDLVESHGEREGIIAGGRVLSLLIKHSNLFLARVLPVADENLQGVLSADVGDPSCYAKGHPRQFRLFARSLGKECLR